MKKVLVSAEMFGYGPITTALNVIKEFKEKRDIEFDFIGNGIALEQAQMSGIFKNYYVCNNYDKQDLDRNKDTFSLYDAMISSENPVGAVFGMEHGIKKVYYIDNLMWMWDNIDQRLNNVSKFFISETIPCKENFERIGKAIKNPVFVGPIREINNRFISETPEKKVIINIGGAGSYLLDKELIIDFYNMLINMILATPNFIELFDRIMICGGSNVIYNLKLNVQSPKIQIKTLSHKEYLEELKTTSHCIMASGLGNYIETLWQDKEILYLPSINYSQFLQFKYYEKIDLGFKLMNWDKFDFFQDVPELLDEESGVNLVVNNIKSFLDTEPNSMVQNQVIEYLANTQKKYFSKRKDFSKKYHQNASQEVAKIIYDDLMKEDEANENT